MHGDTAYVRNLFMWVLLNSGVNPINTLNLHYFAVQTSVLCSTDHESSCFAVLKVKEKSCGKKFDSSSMTCLDRNWVLCKALVEFGDAS